MSPSPVPTASLEAGREQRTIRERPILMSAPMVRGILEGRKTQTRRVMKPQPPEDVGSLDVGAYHPTIIVRGEEEPGEETFGASTWDGEWAVKCPYGRPGDHLWLRETCLRLKTEIGSKVGAPENDEFLYDDDPDYDICWPVKGEAIDLGWRVCPSIHMPRFASRLTLDLTDVRVERVQDISEDDAKAEGAPADTSDFAGYTPHVSGFAYLWQTINAKRGYGWNANPWVWVLAFRVSEGR